MILNQPTKRKNMKACKAIERIHGALGAENIRISHIEDVSMNICESPAENDGYSWHDIEGEQLPTGKYIIVNLRVIVPA